MGHLALKRAIRRAQARRYVTINAAEFADTPKDSAADPANPSPSNNQPPSSKHPSAPGSAHTSLCRWAPASAPRKHAPLHWEAVDFGDPHASPPRPAAITVLRSVRAHGDTKTRRSRRALGMPAFAAQALRDLQQREGRSTGAVFATRDGYELDAANVRREFRAAIRAAGIPGNWSPREFRHTFVSLMSDSGVPVEEIARLAGHTNTRTTEIVYRHQLRPVMEKGAEAMDRLFDRTA